MLMKITKCGSIAALLLASMSWHSGTNYQLVLDLAVYTAAVVMVQQAARAQECLWAAGLAGMVLLLNPVVPVFTPAGNLLLLLFLVGLSPIVISFASWMDATITLYPNLITEPYLQGEPPLHTGEWAAI